MDGPVARGGAPREGLGRRHHLPRESRGEVSAREAARESHRHRETGTTRECTTERVSVVAISCQLCRRQRRAGAQGRAAGGDFRARHASQPPAHLLSGVKSRREKRGVGLRRVADARHADAPAHGSWMYAAVHRWHCISTIHDTVCMPLYTDNTVRPTHKPLDMRFWPNREAPRARRTAAATPAPPKHGGGRPTHCGVGQAAHRGIEARRHTEAPTHGRFQGGTARNRGTTMQGAPTPREVLGTRGRHQDGGTRRCPTRRQGLDSLGCDGWVWGFRRGVEEIRKV